MKDRVRAHQQESVGEGLDGRFERKDNTPATRHPVLRGSLATRGSARVPHGLLRCAGVVGRHKPCENG